MNLYIKLHPTCLSVIMTDEVYEVLPIHTDILRSCKEIRLYLNTLTQYEIENVYFEKPYLRMFGADNKQLASAIIHVQRHFGALVVMINQLFPAAHADQASGRTAKEAVYKSGILTKDVQLSEASAILKGVRDKNYSALQVLALHDALVLRTYFNHKEDK